MGRSYGGRCTNLGALVERGTKKGKRKKAQPEPKPPKPCVLFKGKRTTKLMLEVIPWARIAKYYELAAVTEESALTHKEV